MTINKPTKIFIGILTALEILIPFFIMPGLMMLITFGPFFSIFTSNAAPRPDMILRSIVPMMMVFYPTLMCFAILQFALQIFYIIHEIKNKALTDNYRIFFAIGTFFLPHITMPIYFIAYLWKDNPPKVKSSTVEAAI